MARKLKNTSRLPLVLFDGKEPKYDFSKDEPEDEEDGKFDGWDPEVLRITGLTAEELNKV